MSRRVRARSGAASIAASALTESVIGIGRTDGDEDVRARVADILHCNADAMLVTGLELPRGDHVHAKYGSVAMEALRVLDGIVVVGSSKVGEVPPGREARRGRPIAAHRHLVDAAQQGEVRCDRGVRGADQRPCAPGQAVPVGLDRGGRLLSRVVHERRDRASAADEGRQGQLAVFVPVGLAFAVGQGRHDHDRVRHLPGGSIPSVRRRALAASRPTQRAARSPQTSVIVKR
eukprot:scaffold107481_cov63-Phaeocystis_antarctica.AAC.3